MDDETLERAADGMKDGVYFGSPVSTVRKKARSSRCWRKARCPKSGKTYLYDGMTGESSSSR